MSLGLGQAAFDYALNYTRKRHQFGRSVAEFQGIQWKFADMAVGLESARLLLWRAASSDEGGFPVTRHTAMSKLHCNEIGISVCKDAIGQLAHQGHLNDRPVDPQFREVRGLANAGGKGDTPR